MQQTKKAFSLVEIIISISIIILLAVVWLNTNTTYQQKTQNTKVIADLETLKNTLEEYSNEKQTLPMP
jgi:type II secretory pathway pseudopilin PulG